MHERVQSTALHSPDRPDTFFAFVAGLYVAALCSPAAVIGLGLWVSGDAAVLYFGMLVAVALITSGVAWGVTRWRGLPERIGATPLAWGLALLPVLAIGGYFVVVATVDSSPVDAGALVGFLFGMAAVLIGIGLVVMSKSRYTAAVVDDESVTCEWTAGWPERARKRLQYATVGALCLLFPLWAGGYALDVVWVSTAAQVLFGPVIFLGMLGQERTYRATPAGIERKNPLVRSHYAWGAFESYAVTDETVVLRWQSWWRPAIRCSRAQLDDERAVVDALAAELPRA